jgi:hypothetical protein
VSLRSIRAIDAMAGEKVSEQERARRRGGLAAYATLR